MTFTSVRLYYMDRAYLKAAVMKRKMRISLTLFVLACDLGAKPVKFFWNLLIFIGLIIIRAHN